MKMPCPTDGPHHPDYYAPDDTQRENDIQAELEKRAESDLRTLDGKLYEYLADCEPCDLARLCEAMIVKANGGHANDILTALMRDMMRDFIGYRTSEASEEERDEIAEGP